MSKTDRQTDNFKGTAIHWKSGIFDCEDNWSILQAPPPAFIKFVKFKKEICPTTGKEHFQTHVCCHRQVRLTQMTSWLKHTKWIPVHGEQHIRNSIDYIEKEETTAPGAEVVINHGPAYLQLHELLLEIAKMYEPMDNCSHKMAMSWEICTSRLVAKDLTWANKLCNPVLKSCWNSWNVVFIQKVSEYAEETNGAFIIEGSASSDPGSSEEESILIE